MFVTKILFVRTRSEKYSRPYGAPPLGLMYLTSALYRKQSHQVKILDMRADMLGPTDVAKEFVMFEPDIVGISSFSVEASMLSPLAEAIKREDSKCPVIVGGPHANASSEDVLKDINVDFLVLGEGERTVPELIDAIISGSNVSLVKGIAFRTNGKIKRTPPREYIQNLDDLDFPRWDTIDLKKYFGLPRFMPFTPKGSTPYMPLMTSRGCPFNCIYCHDILGKRFRPRSARNVFLEMETLYRDYGISDFEIVDDCFNLDKKRAMEICDFIINSGINPKLSFPNGLRGDALDEKLLKRLKRAGTTIISFAPETGSARLQKVIRKNMNLEKLQRMISISSNLRIHTHGFFMLGFPTETKKDLAETLKFISKTKLHTADFFIVNLFPNTELYRQTKEGGGRVPDKFDNIDYHDANFNVSEIDTKELLAYQRKFFMTFYFNPRRIFLLLSSPAIRIKHLLYYVIIFIRRVLFRKRES